MSLLVKFYISEFKARERDLADALRMAVVGARDRFQCELTSRFQGVERDVDLACVFALKGTSRRILENYRAAGKRTLLIDKGLMRASTGFGGPPDFYRIALDEFMPLSRIDRQIKEGASPDRWIKLGMKIQCRVNSEPDWPVIYCGSSQKYCDFHDLGNEHDHSVSVIKKIRAAVGGYRPIIYRPKPSFLDAKPIPGTEFSHSKPTPPLGPMLRRTHAVVVHGSHAGIDSVMGGVPLVTIGPCAARPMASHSIESLSEELFYPAKESIYRWLWAITYWQWSCREMASGEMWRWLRKEMEIPA